jgi:signal peptidase I
MRYLNQSFVGLLLQTSAMGTVVGTSQPLGLACLLGLAWLAARRTFTTVRIRGRSMEPAIYSGTVGVVLRTKRCKLNDVVLVPQPSPQGWELSRKKDVPLFAKRVIAIGGEDGTSGGEQAVPYGFVYLQGDNPAVSLDSRHLGPCPAEAIRGRLIWPRI